VRVECGADQRVTDDHVDFLQHARELAAGLRHAIFVDQVRGPAVPQYR
jgi:hypothetical protein